MAPSLKAFRKFGFADDQAQQIREAIRHYEKYHSGKRPVVTMNKIDTIMNSSGVECIPPGHNSRSPEILYVNEGATGATTVMFVNGRFRLGCWGDIVERGNYD